MWFTELCWNNNTPMRKPIVTYICECFKVCKTVQYLQKGLYSLCVVFMWYNSVFHFRQIQNRAWTCRLPETMLPINAYSFSQLAIFQPICANLWAELGIRVIWWIVVLCKKQSPPKTRNTHKWKQNGSPWLHGTSLFGFWGHPRADNGKHCSKSIFYSKKQLGRLFGFFWSKSRWEKCEQW